ncbi:M13 family metallopeptidase [bacterium]|nr:M13 family metallopeptidase [bacterium]
MNKKSIILRLVLILTLSCGSGTTDKWKSLESEVDPTVKPGDDFFAYGNGRWLKSTEIPADKVRWTCRNEINELTRQQVTKLFDSAGTATAGSDARKVADFRAAYMNETAIESRGIASIKPLLDSIDHVGDKTSLTRLLGRRLRADVDWNNYRSSGILGLSVESGNFGEKTYVAYLFQGGLGLSNRDYYLSNELSMQDLRIKYERYIGSQLKQAGFDRVEQRAKAVVAFETALAKTHATLEASNDDHNAANLWTRTDFARHAPGLDWSLFFAAAGLAGQETFVAWQPGAVSGVAALVASQSLETWKDYLRFQTLHAYADVLPRAFADAALAMRAAVTNQQPAPRSQRAFEATQSAMSDAIGKMYVDRYFPVEQKTRIETIAANVLNVLCKRIETTAWMAQSTRTQALTKLKTFYVGIGYPKTWRDYSDLVIDSMDAIGNLQRTAGHNYRHTIAKLGQPVDAAQWWIAPHTSGAILLFQLNAVNFAAALLQAPKFDPTLSDAANYGAIGAIIGHEAIHFVDLLGAEWDSDRRLRRWWTLDDMSRFDSVAEALVEQFSDYHPLPDKAVNGQLTRSENIADLAGLSAAFDAYRMTLGNRINDKAYVRQQDREFFLGFAQSWRSKITEEGLRTQLASDNHAPDSYRIATVRNIDAWYEAFDVKPGQKLYLEPKARVRIW